MREQLIEKVLPLLENTESQTAEQKKEWKQVLLPQATDEQIQKLIDVFEWEKKKLEEVDKKYQSLINQLGNN